MENSFHKVRRQDRLLDETRSIQLLETSEYGFLSLGINDMGYAYGIPISYAYDKENNVLYFHCAPEGQKLEILQQNNKVSFCVIGETKPISEKFTTLYESVIAFGIVDINLSDDDKRTAIRQLVKKYSPEHVELGETYMEKSFHRTHTFKMAIEHITGKCKK
ncbi:MAG: pyridoxamine 5'-phosphate oxidase family protein [Prevotella sp.]|nr:pyridoxamine 5'-phosphate oxidase family protein [Prevotella sp.]